MLLSFKLIMPERWRPPAVKLPNHMSTNSGVRTRGCPQTGSPPLDHDVRKDKRIFFKLHQCPRPAREVGPSPGMTQGVLQVRDVVRCSEYKQTKRTVQLPDRIYRDDVLLHGCSRFRIWVMGLKLRGR